MIHPAAEKLNLTLSITAVNSKPALLITVNSKPALPNAAANGKNPALSFVTCDTCGSDHMYIAVCVNTVGCG